ncbi:hypothetical protein DPMN_088738 [Dreissena polymorpha]|uniref:Uncharacterized protein n=1 Tax=Dreissena polymorpha TaxID=45954 RepID=A0A9D4QXI9_DREPO|nr:hypothetical protein DPMN_088738 [Dreissena polymorpha]
MSCKNGSHSICSIVSNQNAHLHSLAWSDPVCYKVAQVIVVSKADREAPDQTG